VPELERLRPDHAEAVLEFEVANRAYFARTISDRGDEFFAQFPQRHAARLSEQDAGEGAYYVLVGEGGAVVARFNLILVADGVWEVGYRVAEQVAGRGVATAGVRALCELAASRHGARTLRAATSRGNVASQRVLLKAGFTEAGPADPSSIGGKQGAWYQLDL
jgi:[ribosomal protein S5]-alanine N-acetyltransferase